MIELSKISKQYESTSAPVIQDLSLMVSTGEIVSIVGKSGCGKSTLLNILSGLESPSAGSFTIAGSVGYAAQQDLLLPWRTVGENILFPLELSGNLEAKNIAQAYSLLKMVGMLDSIASYPAQLSGGMRQRVSLARMLLQSVNILLFDEPLSAVDFGSRCKLGRRLRGLIKERNCTAIFVTHNIEEAISIGDRVLVLGNSPASFTFESSINIDDAVRDPITVRKSHNFQDLFESIWHNLEAS